jgi:tetraacyldisaccharide 4'-kinase
MSLDTGLQAMWYRGRRRWLVACLLPLTAIFRLIVRLRVAAFRLGFLRSFAVSRPVIVVGNITVGGTGKTPFVIWLAQHLEQSGVRPGIITRGYGGESVAWPHDVGVDDDPSTVGDEALLLAQRTSAIVVAGPDRVRDAERAIERGADVVLCDDGLQHYRLRRDCEIAIVDDERRMGNGWLLPAGPLREPPARLTDVDLIVLTARSSLRHGVAPVPSVPTVVAQLQLRGVTSLATGETRALQDFAGQKVHAIAGIGNPEGFFQALRVAGLTVDARALPDHVQLRAADLAFPDDHPVLMTEKDAVKCSSSRDSRLWVVRADLVIDEKDAERALGVVQSKITQRTRPSTTAAVRLSPPATN